MHASSHTPVARAVARRNDGIVIIFSQLEQSTTPSALKTPNPKRRGLTRLLPSSEYLAAAVSSLDSPVGGAYNHLTPTIDKRKFPLLRTPQKKYDRAKTSLTGPGYRE
jgi:hypothetical protein